VILNSLGSSCAIVNLKVGFLPASSVRVSPSTVRSASANSFGWPAVSGIPSIRSIIAIGLAAICCMVLSSKRKRKAGVFSVTVSAACAPGCTAVWCTFEIPWVRMLLPTPDVWTSSVIAIGMKAGSPSLATR
jgi:hypothetical protein